MGEQVITFPWADGSLEMKLPASWRILGELKPRESQPAANMAEACAAALAEPIGMQRLASRDLAGRRVVIVSDDHSRPTPVRGFVAPVLAELAAAGVKDEDVEFLIATGVHRASRPEEVEHKLGIDVMSRFRWRSHDGYDDNGLVDVGTTSRGTHVFFNKALVEADLIVLLGSVEPHLLLGFGGGLKMLVPGCAGARTIGRNHLQNAGLEHFDCVGLSGTHSPMRLDLEEGAGFLRKDIFLVNCAMNESAVPTRFFCGDPVKAHRAGEAFVEQSVRLEVPEQSDIVISSSYPIDVDFRQAIKCVGNTIYAAKPGGVVLGLLRCLKGLGEMPLPPKAPVPYPLMRIILKVIGKKRILSLVERLKKGHPVEEIFISHFALQMLRRNNLGLYSDSPDLPPDLGERLGLCRSFPGVAELAAWAESKAPQAPTVWIVPFGGSTYARPEVLN